ncbi:protein translocase subunit SecF [bacterium]|nr:protein translocase subunit SecF [bacterium]
MEFIKPGTNIDFLKFSRPAAIFSGVLIVVSFAVFFLKGFNYGIDFAGGVELRAQFPEGVTAGEVRDTVTGAGIGGADVVSFMIEGRNVFAIKAKGQAPQAGDGEEALPDTVHRIVEALNARFGSVEIVSTDMVGARVGADLRRKALSAVTFSMLGILAYLAWRFNVRYSPGAVIAIAHDVIIVAGAFALTGREISLTVVAALLTIAGYSVNDTIVVFDRIREGHTTYRGMELSALVNRCLNDTLSRTILTSLTVLLVVAAMYALGSEIIRDFSFALLLGVFVGTYSTLFIATPTYVALEAYSRRRRQATRKR